MKNSALTLTVAALIFGSTQLSFAADLTVAVEGITNNKGIVQIALFDNSTDFPASSARVAGHRIVAIGNNVHTIFKNLKPGSYAVAVFQDLNGDEKLNRNLFGAPTEPYGFSSLDASKLWREPEFSAAAFELGSDSKSISVHLVQ